MYPAEEPISERLSDDSRRRRERRVESRRSQFLAGPIPLSWLIAAGRLPGKALQVGLAIWYRRKVGREPDIVVTPTLLERFGVSRRSGYRALRNLQRAKLIAVERRRGRSPSVRIKNTG